ncbi:MAG TPA: LptF/LptG family permease [Longimicrobiales bacterium]|nr:LptF/LptG family permease [Longimicrobiales bacterium]
MLFFRTIDRYVAREFMRLFIIFITAAPLLFILGDWTDNIGRYSEQGLSVGTVALSYVYQMPLFISWSFPVAALIATVFTVSTMTRHSEMTAAKAGGLSFFRTLAVLPLLGVLLTFAGIGLTELVPITTAKTKEVLGEVRPTTGDMRHEFVYTSRDGHVFTIRRLSLGTAGLPPSMGGITIEFAAPQTGATRIAAANGALGTQAFTHISAKSARWDEDAGLWTLEDGYYRTFVGETDPAGNDEHAYRFQRMQIASFNATPEQLMARTKDPEEMRYAELGEFIETLRRSGGQPLKLMVEQAQKLAIPAATLIIILFGAPLANSSPRGGAAYGIGVSLAVTVIYMMLFRITGAAGAAGTIDPMHAAWAPNVLFAVAALVLLTRVRT